MNAPRTVTMNAPDGSTYPLTLAPGEVEDLADHGKAGALRSAVFSFTKAESEAAERLYFDLEDDLGRAPSDGELFDALVEAASDAFRRGDTDDTGALSGAAGKVAAFMLGSITSERTATDAADAEAFERVRHVAIGRAEALVARLRDVSVDAIDAVEVEAMTERLDGWLAFLGVPK